MGRITSAGMILSGAAERPAFGAFLGYGSRVGRIPGHLTRKF